MDLYHPVRAFTWSPLLVDPPFTKKSSNSCTWNLDITRKYDSGCKSWTCWKNTQAVQDWSFLPDSSTDQNWEQLHFAGEIPASQRCIFHPVLLPHTFPTTGPYCWGESIPGATKLSLFHLPGRGDCAPCAPHIPGDGCARNRDAQLAWKAHHSLNHI